MVLTGLGGVRLTGQNACQQRSYTISYVLKSSTMCFTSLTCILFLAYLLLARVFELFTLISWQPQVYALIVQAETFQSLTGCVYICNVGLLSRWRSRATSRSSPSASARRARPPTALHPSSPRLIWPSASTSESHHQLAALTIAVKLTSRS